MGERDDARHSIESARGHMSEIADELSQRARPSYMKERAREYVTDRGSKLYDRASSSPMVLATLGGLIGAFAGMLFGRSRQRSRVEEWPGYGTRYESRYRYEQQGNGHLKERAREAAGGLREKKEEIQEKAAELKDRAVEKTDEFKEGLREKADRIRYRAGGVADAFYENPMLFALGAVACGAIVASFIPLSESEQRVMAPMKQKTMEQVKSVAAQATEAISAGVKEKLETPSTPSS